ncbi:MAG: hypothetical protein LBH25_13655 [Fibromonadaceae bacterium]|jgi:nucleoside phosphorylase|nr:hypothetical protein [Fibromonadaceae bacterium]
MPVPSLFVFATEMERDGVFPNGVSQGYDCLVSGVGILSTAIHLSRALQSKAYKTAIQIGIAGAYPSSGLRLAEVVEVMSDCMLEFLPWEPNTFFASGALPFAENLSRVKGTTVLRCSSTKEMASARGNVAQIETMEGAAFFAACKEYGTQAVQIRAISNYAALQEKSEWKIEDALNNLKKLFVSYPA